MKCSNKERSGNKEVQKEIAYYDSPHLGGWGVKNE